MDSQTILQGLNSLGYNFTLESENESEMEFRATETNKIISVLYDPAKDGSRYNIVAAVTGARTVENDKIRQKMRELSHYSGTWNCLPGNDKNEYFIMYQCQLRENPLKSAKLVLGTFNNLLEEAIDLFSAQTAVTAVI